MIVGLNFAKNIFRKKPAEDLKVVFLDPSRILWQNTIQKLTVSSES